MKQNALEKRVVQLTKKCDLLKHAVSELLGRRYYSRRKARAAAYLSMFWDVEDDEL